MTSEARLLESMRWYGPHDPVPLAHIRQAGALGVFTSLHEIPYGEIWPPEAIRSRKLEVEQAGLKWVAVESVPVHEDLKTGKGDVGGLLENYKQTLRNLAAEGIPVVVYNFMPVLDWIRTDVRFRMLDGSETLRFDPVQFAAFELFALKRHGASEDYSPEQLQAAGTWWNALAHEAREKFIQGIVDVFPGCKFGFGLEDIRAMLARYEGIGVEELRANLARFLREVIPVAEDIGVRLAIHPDDPPFSVLGLPRIVSTEADLLRILAMASSPANGICFCTGSLGVRPGNDLPGMVARLGSRIHAVHLRSTERLSDGSFYEANHLEGGVDMVTVVRALLELPHSGPVPFRPDHGRRMLDDLAKDDGAAPGYTCLGRVRGLAELRGVIRGLSSRLGDV